MVKIIKSKRGQISENNIKVVGKKQNYKAEPQDNNVGK